MLLLFLGAAAGSACRMSHAYAGGLAVAPDFEHLATELVGTKVGFEAIERRGGTGYAELRFLDSLHEPMDLWSLVTGLRTPASYLGPLALRGGLDLGVGLADVERFRNRNPIYSLGIALLPALRLTDTLVLEGSIGYRFYDDATDPTTCNDGTRTSQPGSGACASHGGVDHANDPLGNGHGWEASLVLRFGWPVTPAPARGPRRRAFRGS